MYRVIVNVNMNLLTAVKVQTYDIRQLVKGYHLFDVRHHAHHR